jgi:hypothetical protein
MSRAGGNWVCAATAAIELWAQTTAVPSNLPIMLSNCYTLQLLWNKIETYLSGVYIFPKCSFSSGFCILLGRCHRFGETYCPHLQDLRWRQIPEHHHHHRREKPQMSHIKNPIHIYLRFSSDIRHTKTCYKQKFWMRIQVLTAARMKMSVFWDVAPCNLIDIDRRFRGTYCLHHYHTDDRGGKLLRNMKHQFSDVSRVEFRVLTNVSANIAVAIIKVNVKRRSVSTRLHGATYQKTAIFISCRL